MAFMQSGIEFLCSQDVQYLPDMCQVLFSTLRKYKNIAKVHQDEFPNIGPEDSIHNALKDGRSVRQFEGKGSKFIQSHRGFKLCFGAITILYFDVVIPLH